MDLRTENINIKEPKKVRCMSKNNLGDEDILEHYSDIIMSSMAPLKSPGSRLFAEPFVQAQIKEYIKAPRYWPLGGKVTGDRWNPRTMVQ